MQPIPDSKHHPAPGTAGTAAGQMPVLQLAGVSLQRGQTRLFEQLDLQLGEQHIGLIGHNGAGKTSLLRLLCGLETPDQGKVLRNGQDIHRDADGQQRSQWLGMMFQNPDDQIIFPLVEEELALGLQPRGIKKHEAIGQARHFLAGRGLEAWAGRSVASLSQGQRQHVCWLAMLLAGPATLLLDEPYASLDLPGQIRLADELWRTDRQLVVSTHQLEHVRRYPRVIWLDNGRVRADGDGASICAAYEQAVRQGDGRVAQPPHTAGGD